jgi:hypothetical protein
VARVRVGGREWVVLERSDWDRDHQLLIARYRHLPLGGGPAVRSEIVHRYLLAGQLVRLLAAEGWRSLELGGALARPRPYDERAEHLTLTARAPR